MIQYVEEIIIPYIEATRENIVEKEAPALVIMDNFKGQVTPKMNSLLEANDIHVCLLPPNTTDLLQPMDRLLTNLPKSFYDKNTNTSTQRS